MKTNTTKITLILTVAALCGSGLLFADDNKKLNGSKRGLLENFYIEGCGGCHFPYQPGFLPPRSWAMIMNGLEDHFGENAEMTKEEAIPIRNFLQNNAAKRTNRGPSNKIMIAQGKDSVLLRITDTSYFRHEHDEIPARMVKENAKVGSFSNCDACHTRAMQGSFDEHQVRIPGYGRWDD